MNLNSKELNLFIKDVLKEDIGKADITTRLVIPKGKKTKAIIVSKENGVICGIDIAGLVFKAIGKNIKFKPLISDGDEVRKGEILAKVFGDASRILTAERVALNFLGMLSGIASKTRLFLEGVKPYKVKILDTRKTLPALRSLEKYAVRVGGGYNHRMRLDEMILVKDNHLKVINGYQGLQGLTRGRKGYKVEIEVKNLKEFKQALKKNPDIIMLDNMKIDDIKKAIIIKRKAQNAQHKTLLEVSGNISLNTVKKYASCGVDFISVGSLTKDIDSLDISLDIL